MLSAFKSLQKKISYRKSVCIVKEEWEFKCCKVPYLNSVFFVIPFPLAIWRKTQPKLFESLSLHKGRILIVQKYLVYFCKSILYTFVEVSIFFMFLFATIITSVLQQLSFSYTNNCNETSAWKPQSYMYSPLVFS